jgi:hypothetical protein
MRHAVEILVLAARPRRLDESLDGLRSARVVATPTKGAACRMVVAPLADLDSPQRRAGLEWLLGSTTKVPAPVPLVLVSEAQDAVRAEGAQALASWARRCATEPLIALDPRTIRRMVMARQVGAESRLIATASVEVGKLVVWSCEPKRFEVPVADVPALARLDAQALRDFEVSPSGSRIRWPEADIDLNLDTVRERADPRTRRENEARMRQEARRMAKAIRLLREEHGLTQADVPGLSERQVRRLELGATVPHTSTLGKLAHAHGMSVEEYLAALARARGSTKARRRTVKPRKGAGAGRLRTHTLLRPTSR